MGRPRKQRKKPANQHFKLEGIKRIYHPFTSLDFPMTPPRRSSGITSESGATCGKSLYPTKGIIMEDGMDLSDSKGLKTLTTWQNSLMVSSLGG